MKCEHCGKNEVSFIYRIIRDGQTEEKRLCAECAEKLGYLRRFTPQNRPAQQNFSAFLDGGALFGNNGLLDVNALFGNNGLLDPNALFGENGLLNAGAFSGNPSGGGVFPVLVGRILENPFDDFFAEMPALGASPAAEKTEAPPDREELARFDRQRRRNALQYALKQAVEQEAFERAAELRDALRELERQEKQNPDRDTDKPLEA